MSNRWNKLLVAMMVILLSSGCSYSLSEIREFKPYYTLTSTKPPQDLAKCIELKMRARRNADVVNLEEYPDKTYRVTLTIPAHTAIADILVKPSDSGSVVEFRRRGYLHPQSELQEVMERCAK